MTKTVLADAICMNAAGTARTEPEARLLLESSAHRILVGTFSAEPRSGNLGRTYYYHPDERTAWHADGMYNEGVRSAKHWLPRIHRQARIAKKKLGISIAGRTPKEFGDLAELVRPHVDYIELHMGFKVLVGAGEDKANPCYQPGLFLHILEEVADVAGSDKRVSWGVKLSPNESEPALRLIARHIRVTGFVQEIVCVNAYPATSGRQRTGEEGLAFREAESSNPKHLGYMSGAALKPHGLRVTHLMHEELPDRHIIGCGGIETAQDALDYMAEGATGFAIGVALRERGKRVFDDVLSGITQPLAA